MSTIIKLRCIDQVLALESTPVVASGGLGEDFIEVSFCSKWDGLAKTAVFWRTEADAYHVQLDENDTCPIPPEVLIDEGAIYFGLFGVGEDGKQRTSEVVRYVVTKGAITSGSKPSDPTPDIYTQLLANYAEVLNGVQEIADAAEASRQAAEQSAAAAEETARQAEEAELEIAAEAEASRLAAERAAGEAEASRQAAESAAAEAAEAAAREVTEGHIADKSNPHGVTAEQAGAVNKAGDTMMGDLTMSGGKDVIFKDAYVDNRFRIFEYDGTAYLQHDDAEGKRRTINIFPKSKKDIANALGFETNESGSSKLYNILHSGNISTYAAPAGFGLGTYTAYGTDIGDFHNPSGNGWFYVSSSSKNGPASYSAGSAFVIARSSKWFDVYLFPTVQDVYGCVLHLSRKGDLIEPWEWVNPPMQLGVEYRTTERIGDKAVYKKNVDGVTYYRLDDETERKPYVEAGGGSRIVTGTYVGTGEVHSPDSPMSLTFDRPPKWIAFFTANGRLICEDTWRWVGSPSVLTTEWGTGFALSDSGKAWGTDGWGEIKMKCSEDRKTIYWYASGYTSSTNTTAHLNGTGTTYGYMAIL